MMNNDMDDLPELWLTAALNLTGNGIELADKSGGTGNLTVSNVNSTTAAALGIAGTFNNTTP